MKVIVTSLVVLWSVLGFSQARKEVKEADKLFKQGMYEEALPMFKKFITIDPTNIDYIYKYGGCAVMVTNNPKEALNYLLKAEEYGKKDEEIAYFIGRAYEKSEQYEKAKSYYERFKDVADRKTIRKLKVKKRIRSCKKALK